MWNSKWADVHFHVWPIVLQEWIALCIFCPRQPSACHAVPQSLEHSRVSHGGSSNILLLSMISQAQDELIIMETWLQWSHAPGSWCKWRQTSCLAREWLWIDGTGYYELPFRGRGGAGVEAARASATEGIWVTGKREYLLAVGGVGRLGKCTHKAEPKAHMVLWPLVQTWHLAILLHLPGPLPSSATVTSDLIRIAKKEHSVIIRRQGQLTR